MKSLTLCLAVLALAACGSKDEAVRVDTAVAQPPAEQHVVQTKIVPDTLIDERGQFCTVTTATYDRVALGGPYNDCDWRPRE